MIRVQITYKRAASVLSWRHDGDWEIIGTGRFDDMHAGWSQYRR